MKIVIIYPNQLYSNHPALRKDQKIVIVEDPLFFGDQQYPLNFHKKKLLLHFASIESYKEELKGRGYDAEVYPYEKLREKNQVFLRTSCFYSLAQFGFSIPFIKGLV